MTVRVEVTLDEDGHMSVSGSFEGCPMDAGDMLEVLETAVDALGALHGTETLQ